MKKLFIFLVFFCSHVLAATVPEANLIITPIKGEINQEFVFDASDSFNTNGQKNGLEYRFKFTNNHNWTKWDGKSIQKFKPQNVGTFRAKVQIRDKKTRTINTTYRTYRVVGGIFRKAHIRVTPTQIRAGEPVYFTIMVTLPRTDDPNKVMTRWDFNADGYYETAFSRQRTVTHVFSSLEVGQVSPIAEVQFPDGSKQIVRGIEKMPETGGTRKSFFKKLWSKIRINSPVVVAPILDISPGKQGYNEDTTFRFDISKSKIPSQAWVEWNFDGEEFFKDKKIISKKFTSPGRHEVRVRTCYNRKVPQCAETVATIDVKEDALDYQVDIRAQNITRSTSFSSNNSNQFFSAVVGDRIKYGASIRKNGSSNSKFSYRWDFNGDGIFDTTFNFSSIAEYTYVHSGKFNPTVQVQNEDGILATGTVRLQVFNNTTPHAYFTVNKRKIYVGDKVKFFPKVRDLQSQHSRLEVRFDVDGDGNWDMPFRVATNHEWRYEKPGKYIAYMQVRDISKKVRTIARTVTVFPYEKPKAKVIISQRFGDTKTNFVFDASRSTGQNLKYYWDFDYQGKNDLVSEGMYLQGQREKITKRLPIGENVIGLRVVDGIGNFDQIHFSVFVGQYINKKSKTSNSQNLGFNNSSSKLVSNTPEVKTDKLATKEELLINKTKQIRPTKQILFQGERELVRADMFFFLYKAKRTPPPIPMKNPFKDIKETDWFYDVAIQSYKDGFSRPPKFYPAQKIGVDEAQVMIKRFLHKDVSFSKKVTRQDFHDAIYQTN